MALIAVIFILVVWLVIKAADAVKPTKPPIKNIEAHTKMLMQLQPESRKKFIKKF